MTIIYLVKKLSDENGKIISLDDLNKLNKDNVYNVRVNDKNRVGLTTEEIKLIIGSDIDKIYIHEAYNKIQGLAERVMRK